MRIEETYFYPVKKSFRAQILKLIQILRPLKCGRLLS